MQITELICCLISSVAVYVLFLSLLVLRHSQMVAMVIAALKPTFNVDSLAHAVLLVGGAPQGLAGVIPVISETYRKAKRL